MRKRSLIEAIQAIINGGDTSPDVKKKAHPAVVGAHINASLSEIVYSARPELLANLAVPYENLPIVSNSAGLYFTNLPVRPMAGPKSITLAVDSVGRAISLRQSISDNFNLNYISPIQHCVTGIVRGKKLIYNGKPKDGKGNEIEYVDLHIVAEFNDLADDDFVVIPGAENIIIRMVLQTLGYSLQIPEDVLNDLKTDRDSAQRKYQNIL